MAEQQLGTSSQVVPVGPGLVIGQPLAEAFKDVAGYDVTVHVAPQEGRLVASRLVVDQRAGGPPVTLDGIRHIPVGALVRAVGANNLQEVEGRAGGYETVSPNLSEAEVAELVAQGPTDQTLRTVAYLYRYALAVGDPPVKVVEQTMKLSRSKTGRWIALCREKGYLNPSEGAGKAAG
ncbi:hypothetical protein [Pseudonocardia ailaonensis]|uniref:hypothetical protein n=1 Tax=Pseudonocardia ailaonensis TaxID=367279 RepID=UPI0031D316B3